MRGVMLDHLVITNPKRRWSVTEGRDDLFPYYAGFSGGFARELIGSSRLDRQAIFMDPWNGSGTSTVAAALYGVRALGFDLNPVMAVVAKAKLLPRAELPSVLPLTTDILKKIGDFPNRFVNNDPLLTWFAPSAAAAIRAFDRSIHMLLVSPHPTTSSVESASTMSLIASFFYVALFRTVRHLLVRFQPSNPTWITRPSSLQSRIRPSVAEIHSTFKTQLERMCRLIEAEPRELDLATTDCVIHVASSDSLPVKDNTVDFVLSSPPYCTRIDYGIATSPELAVLGFALADNLRELRRALIGTPTIHAMVPSPSAEWGITCNSFLDCVIKHPSKAAKSYYYKTYVQYFAAIARSISEIARCIKPQGKCVVVIQDSYFKDVRADLPLIFTEIASNSNLRLTRQADFPMSRTLVNINTKSRRYRANNCAIESVLCFAKN